MRMPSAANYARRSLTLIGRIGRLPTVPAMQVPCTDRAVTSGRSQPGALLFQTYLTNASLCADARRLGLLSVMGLPGSLRPRLADVPGSGPGISWPVYLKSDAGLRSKGAHMGRPGAGTGPERASAHTAAPNGGDAMPLKSSSFQTPVTASLDGQVTAMDVLDPLENNEKTSLLEEDDEFDVKLTWMLTGAGTPLVRGSWLVSLYSDDMDGVGAMTGLIAGPATIPITGGIGPLTFEHTFKVVPPKPKEGIYKLTATIHHSPTGNQARLSEMLGHAEATPVTILRTVVESN
jgi:hypothetical protein